MSESIFGIIPARGGSKRLPGKNLMKLGGVSLLEHTVREARKALPVSVVSTEDKEITLEALRCGVRVLWRPDRLATDEATSEEVIEHAVNAYIGCGFKWFCLLQVTSPLRTVEDIRNAYAIAEEHNKPVVSTHNGKRNGAIYIGKMLAMPGRFFEGAVEYEMPYERSIDIDTIEDFNEAERIYNDKIRVTP